MNTILKYNLFKKKKFMTSNYKKKNLFQKKKNIYLSRIWIFMF